MIEEVSEEFQLKELREVLFQFYKIMPYRQPKKGTQEFNDGYARWVDSWHLMISNGMGKILGLKKDGKFIGAIGLVVSPSLEDGVMTCMEAFWYVDENQRGQGLKLFLKAEKVAKQMGAKRMVMMYLQNSMPEKVKSVYERMGYKYIQTSYFKDL